MNDAPQNMQNAATAITTTKLPQNRLSYDGQLGTIYGIWLLTLFLNILTLGFYRFWGKTRMRQYVASSFRLLNDRLEYSGTGGELFKGFLKALPIALLVYVPLIIGYLAASPWLSVMILPIVYLWFVARYAALRYQLSRTSWRGIRGHLTGSAFVFGFESILRILISWASLGLATPYSDIKLYKFMAQNAYFGKTQVQFDGTADPLFMINLKTIFLAIPTLGISRFWYTAALIRHQYAHTRIGSLRLKATHTAEGLIALFFVNLLILFFTFGLGMPFVIQRNLTYFSENTFILGNIDSSGILQSEGTKGTSGEGLADVFDVDAGLF